MPCWCSQPVLVNPQWSYFYYRQFTALFIFKLLAQCESPHMHFHRANKNNVWCCLLCRAVKAGGTGGAEVDSCETLWVMVVTWLTLTRSWKLSNTKNTLVSLIGAIRSVFMKHHHFVLRSVVKLLREINIVFVLITSHFLIAAAHCYGRRSRWHTTDVTGKQNTVSFFICSNGYPGDSIPVVAVETQQQRQPCCRAEWGCWFTVTSDRFSVPLCCFSCAAWLRQHFVVLFWSVRLTSRSESESSKFL